MKKRGNPEKIQRIIQNIKSIKIQGARNIAESALHAYSLSPTKQTKNRLMKARPTEPMLINVLNLLDKQIPKKQILLHFDISQKKINNHVLKIIKSGDVIFTHCHSTNVVNSLINAKKKGKKFQVYNTETRPLFQGRITARELKKAGIETTMFIDSAIDTILEKKQGTKKVDKIFLGCDAILKKGIINKIGSAAIAELAKIHKIPLYIIADSWKYFPKNIKIEQRNFREIWKSAPKNIKIKNPVFELVEKKYITKIVTELGILSYNDFLKKV